MPFSRVATGQEISLPIPDHPLNSYLMLNINLSIDSERDLTSKPKVEKLLSAPTANIKITLGNYLNDIKAPPDYWNTYAREPNHRYVLQYDGLRGVIYDQLRRVAMKYYNRECQTYWGQQYASGHIVDVDQRIRDTYDRCDTSARWWERSIFESFPLDKGGSEIRIHKLGSTFEVVRTPWVSVNNAGRISWDGWRLDVAIRDEIARLNSDDNDPMQQTKPDRIRKVRFGINTPSSELIRSDRVVVTANIRVNLRVDQLDSGNKSSVQGLMRITAFHKNAPWLEAQIRGTAKPLINEYAVEVGVALLSF